MKNKKKSKKLKRQRKILISIILTIIVVIIFGFFKLFNKNEDTVESNKIQSDTKTYNASLLACGDIMAHMPQLKAQYNPDTKEYSFDNNYKCVKDYIKNADLAIANLETTLCGNDVYAYSSYPTFNTPDSLADSLKNAGFDLLSTINNHSFDMSSLGVERTLSTLKEKGFDTVGTRQNKSDNDYIIKNVNDIKLGITAYTYGQIKDGTKYLNGIKVSEEKNDLMNVFDCTNVDNAFNTIYSTVKKYEENTDMQIVIIHWGDEYNRTPNNFQTQLAQKLCDAGVDIIIGSHPHVVQPVEIIKSSDNNHETLVIYSLGNYISNQRRQFLSMYTEDGLMVDIDIKKEGNNEATIEKVKCIPTWVDKYKNGSKTVYEIIPIDDNILEKASYVDSNYLEQSYKNTSELININDRINIVESPFKK